jgi:SAM-dependent methyltransferase
MKQTSAVETARTPPVSRELATDRYGDWALAYLRHAPFALCLRELDRLFALEKLGILSDDQGKVLDVGCGDGFWWTLQPIDRDRVHGVDISKREVDQAAQHINAALTDISREVPFPGVRFSTIIGNCSLEHVRDINEALSNLRAAAAPGARLTLFVPTPHWAFHGRTQSMLLRRFPRLAMTLSGALNGFFQHWHLYDVEVWKAILERNGWRVKECHALGNDRAEFLFRLFLPSSFLGFLAKKGFGSYPNRLLKWLPDQALAPARSIMLWALRDPVLPVEHPSAYEYVVIAETR